MPSLFQRMLSRFRVKQPEKRGIGIDDTQAILKLFNIDPGGPNVNIDAVVGIPALLRAVSIRMNLLATMPRKVYRRLKNGDVEHAFNHPINVLLEYMPQDELTPFDFWSSIEFTALMHGGGGAEIIRDERSGRPVSLRLMRYGAQAYKYNLNSELLIADNETGKLYHASDVLFIPGLLISDGTKVQSVISLFRQTLGEQISAQLFANQFFKNAPHISGVYTYTGSRKDAPEAKSYAIQEYFGGLANAGRVLPIANGENFQQLKPINMADAQMLDMRRFGVEDVARIFGVPVSLLMELSKPSYNSLSQLFLQFKITTLDPRTTQYDQEINRKLLRTDELGTYYEETDIDELMWASPEERMKYWEGLYKMSAIKPNEIRRYLNMNKVEGGDEVFVPTNNVMPMSQVLKNENTNERAKTNGTVFSTNGNGKH